MDAPAERSAGAAASVRPAPTLYFFTTSTLSVSLRVMGAAPDAQVRSPPLRKGCRPCPTGALWRLSARCDRDAAPPALEAAMTGGGRPGRLARLRAAVTDPDSLRSWSVVANDGIIATAG